MQPKRQLMLGAFFIVVIALLGYYTLFLADWNLFGEQQTKMVYFQSADGLRQGDPVLVAGIRQGRVRELAYDPSAPLERRISAQLLFDRQVPLREGFEVRIEDSTLLGGKQVTVEPGPPGAPPVAEGAMLMGRVAPDPLARISQLVAENGDAVQRIVENFDAVVADLRAGKGVLGRLTSDEGLADDLQASMTRFQTTFDNAAALTSDLRAGKGVLGRLLTDEDLAGKLGEIGERLATITADLEAFSGDLREGKGVLGRLVRDEPLAEDARLVVENLREITRKINEGQGTLGRLIVDDEMGAGVAELVGKVRAGEGTIGKLFTREEIYDRLALTADNLAAASTALRNGEGTLGRLVMDDDLYEQVRRALGIVTRSLEEYREAAPVTTFTSVLFGAF